MTRLYVVPASHPCAAVEKALQLKRVPYSRVWLITSMHVVAQQLRFGTRTVPGIVFDDGEKVAGSRAIMRAIERRHPQPSLWPADDEARRRSEFVEEWGEEVLQPVARRLAWNALGRRRDAIMSYTEGAKVPLPDPVVRASIPVVVMIEQRLNRASDENVRADLANLDEHLDRADRFLEQGLLGQEQVTAADLQVGSSVRLMQTLDDLAPRIDARPVGALARRLFGDFPGRCPAGALPAEWLSVAA